MIPRVLTMIILFSVLGNYSCTAQQWLTSFEEAKQKALEQEKHIILVFSGSDWCIPCIKLERYVLNTEKFLQNTSQNYILLKADFPRKKKNKLSQEIQEQNNRLVEKYNKRREFPMIVVLNKMGNKLGEIGYKKVNPDTYISFLDQMIKK